MVDVVPVSEFARADLATPAVYEAMFSNSMSFIRKKRADKSYVPPFSSGCIDVWPVIRNKAWFYGDSGAVSVDNRS